MDRVARRGADLARGVVLDVVFGDPPNRAHPVAWLGAAIGRLVERAPSGSPLVELLAGIGVLGIVVSLVTVAAMGVARLTQSTGRIAALGRAIAVAITFSYRTLDDAVHEVEVALAGGDEAAAREALRALVSRTTVRLDTARIASAAIESAAENLADSIVAPLLAYVLGGLPAAAAYRAVNTLDAMIGYHGRFEYLGKPSARLDDALNILPARLAGLAICFAAPVAGGSPRQAMSTMRRDCRLTESPNAGWPMAAMAGALGVWLEKPGHYRLNVAGRAPEAADLARARRVLAVASLLSLAAASAIAEHRRAA